MTMETFSNGGSVTAPGEPSHLPLTVVELRTENPNLHEKDYHNFQAAVEAHLNRDLKTAQKYYGLLSREGQGTKACRHNRKLLQRIG